MRQTIINKIMKYTSTVLLVASLMFWVLMSDHGALYQLGGCFLTFASCCFFIYVRRMALYKMSDSLVDIMEEKDEFENL